MPAEAIATPARPLAPPGTGASVCHVPGSRTVVARLVARRVASQGVIWGLVFGAFTWASAAGYTASYPTLLSRQILARSLGDNTGLRALLGEARRIDTVAGFTAWRVGLLVMAGAVWGLLTGTRLVRGEEEAGRWELLLAGSTTRRGAAVQATAGLAAGWASLFLTTALCSIAIGRGTSLSVSAGEAIFYAVSVTAGAAVFLAVGSVAGQLAATRRKAAMISAGIFGASVLMRIVADSGSGLRWLRWASPLGWIEQAHPLTGSRPVLLLPVLAVVAVLATLTVWLAGVRDLGTGALPSRDAGRARTRLLFGPIGLAMRTARPVALAWLAALGVAGLLFGLVANSAASAVSGSASFEQTLERLGVRGGGPATYLGITFLVLATLISLVAAGQVVATRDEEAEGRLEQLVVRPVGRLRWLGGRLAVATVLLLACGVTAGACAWAGCASQGTDLGLGRVVAAGVNTVPGAVLVLGIGTLVHAVAPRWTAVVTYGLTAWSFLIDFVVALVKGPSWLLDTSPLYHLAPAPAVDPNWSSAAVLAGLGVAAAVIGAAHLARRDLTGA
jgi:ABC-2 type transport system permease protein